MIDGEIGANLEKQNGIFQETPNNVENAAQTKPEHHHNPDLASTPQRQCSPRATHLQRGPPQGEKSPDFLKRSIFFLKPSARIQRIGADFGYRFLWRPLLLAFFATLNAAFFPAGDVLLLFVVVGCVLFFARIAALRLSLVLLVENHIRKSCARLRVLLFLYNFFLRKTSFPTEKLGEGLPLLRLSLALLVENYIFGKATPASRATFFMQFYP